MKKLLALFLVLILTLAIPYASLAEEEEYTYYTDTFLDIPWSITAEEFIQIAQDTHNLTFSPTEEEPLWLELEQPQTWSFWDEPVQSVMAYCMSMDISATGSYAVSLPLAGSERKDSYECITVDFSPRPGETSLEDRVAQFASLFSKCQTNLGEVDCPRMSGKIMPDELDSSLPFYEQMDGDFYSFPRIDGVFQQDVALEMLSRPYDFVTLSASFRNHFIALRYEPSNTEAPITVRFTTLSQYMALDEDLRQYLDDFPPFPSSK